MSSTNISRLPRLALLAGLIFFLFFGVIYQAWEKSAEYLADLRQDWLGGQPAAGAQITITTSQAAAMVSEVSAIKPAVIDFYFSNDRLPRPGDLTPGGRVRLLDNGALEAMVGSDSKAAVYWRLRPHADSRQDWDCVSPNVANLAERLPGCRFDPAYQKDTPITQDMEIVERLTFAFDSSGTEDLVAGSRERLQQLIQQLAPTPNRRIVDIALSGYADPMGSEGRNERLAEARVAAVRDALLAAGVARSLLTTRVVGADPRPSPCPSSLKRGPRIQCLADSRRVDLVVHLRKQL
jgi:outer membrane protein OmpA-like peptidoglycan-associated protein